MIRLTEAEAARLMTGKKPLREKKVAKKLVAASFSSSIDRTTLVIPLVIESVANKREHWGKASGRKGTQRKTIQKALAEHIETLSLLVQEYHRGTPIHVRLTRLAPGELDPANLWSGMKTPEDGIAEWFGAVDKPPLWLCEVAQEKTKEYGLKVEIWT